MKATILFIHPGGTIQTIGSDLDLSEIGATVKRRASHVWPVHPVKQIAFRILRKVFGERGKVAEWCRSWRGPWEVRFVDRLNPRRKGAVQFSHPSRRVCIDWEVKRLNERLSR